MKILKFYVLILTSCICFSLTTCLLFELELIHTCNTFGYMSRLHPLLQGSSLLLALNSFAYIFVHRKQITNTLYNLTRKKLIVKNFAGGNTQHAQHLFFFCFFVSLITLKSIENLKKYLKDRKILAVSNSLQHFSFFLTVSSLI